MKYQKGEVAACPNCCTAWRIIGVSTTGDYLIEEEDPGVVWNAADMDARTERQNRDSAG